MRAWEDIPGWFDYPDVYDMIYDHIPDGGKMAEVGCYLGKSLVYMKQRMFYGWVTKSFDIIAVDMWDGQSLVKPIDDMFKKFWLNIQSVPLISGIYPIIGESVKVAEWFDYDYFDAVFIDADHSYSAVTADIKAWLPKVKKGGILAGHDYDNDAWVSVKNAVDDFFGDRVKIMGRCWIYNKE